MIGDRERSALDDLGATWMGQGVDLAERMKALSEYFETTASALQRVDRSAAQAYGLAAELLLAVLACEWNPPRSERSPLRAQFGGR